jgi:rare lipoprotein A
MVGHSESGGASYYAMKYQFRKTASGEIFNQMALTGAHRTLPFGTMVRVTNTKNNQSVTVRINDRGPFVQGRVIDLSRAAFAEIGNLKSGVIDVRIEVVE